MTQWLVFWYMDILAPAQSSVYLLTVAVLSVLTLLILIVKFRIHAFIALILVSIVTAIAAGIPSEKLLSTLTQGFGGTLASIALLVGLGAMIGKILEHSGGATILADTLITRFGEKRAPLALGIASLLFGFPIFFDAGLIVLMPIIFSVAKRFSGSLLVYALPCAGAFAVMHAFVPPHPGPVAASGFLGADIGLLLIVGLAIAIPTWYLGAYLFALYCGKKFHIPIDNDLFGQNTPADNSSYPRFSTVLFILLLPVVLISFNTVLSTLIIAGLINSEHQLSHVFIIIGQTPIALLITLLSCLIIFSKQYGAEKLEQLCAESLAPICAIILVTGAGGMFGGVLRASGIGDSLASILADTGMPLIVAAFLIAASLRVAQGSATVALTTTAALVAPIVTVAPDLSSLDLCFIVISIAGGSTVLSHFNDSGFWLVSRLLNMDVKTTLKTWTVMETLLGTIAFLFAWILSLIF
ncbi:GntP family permease [Aliiglaciecola sp. 2_MG-2023]|uniref:GntP family permease n=1 Tax=unclassified Aliiglaciecola TaxID=2593648 RepID=UPI0026E19D64|nr:MULTISPECIES: GntP family permease [unclassified Aliiglaciecola]MDO6712436.1 GntP family permease [Aliiglaciecola sp. 2_MG-2023]MDO6753506.1 GntP family permease [Aliiglaciecola sp. 1_MG-2023]